MKKVLAYGTFDLFHIGHLNFLNRAKEYGDYLIVGVSTDSFNEIKGKKSYIPYKERKSIVKSLECVDQVIPEECWEQKLDDIRKYDADVIVTSVEWKDRFKYLEDYVDVIYLDRTPGISTTMLKNEITSIEEKDNKLNPFLKISIYVFKYLLSFIYLFMKLLLITDNNKVVFISRRSNELTLEYKMYLKELKKYNVNTVVLCKELEEGLLNSIKYIRQILKEMYHLATSRVCVLDSYCIPVSILNHKKSLKIVQTWHALTAIKKFGYQNLNYEDGRNREISRILKMHQNYDYVLSGSKAMTPFFQEAFRTDASKIHEIGSPTVDYLLKNKEDLKDKIYKKYPDFKNKKNVLYVPTFRRDRSVKVDELIKSFDFNNYNLIIKYHPLSKTRTKDKRVYQCEDFNSLDFLTIADYTITDYSSIVAEASLFDKPILIYAYDLDEYKSKNGLNVELDKELPGCVFTDAKSLMKKIKSDEFNLKEVEKFRKKYITNTNGTTSILLTHYILSNLGGTHEKETEVLPDILFQEK